MKLFTLPGDRGAGQGGHDDGQEDRRDSLVDAVVLSAATESEHYEIAVNETLITHAHARGAANVAALLRRNLEQEKHALDVARSAMQTIAQQGIAVAATFWRSRGVRSREQAPRLLLSLSSRERLMLRTLVPATTHASSADGGPHER